MESDCLIGASDACAGHLILSFMENDRATWEALDAIGDAFASHHSMWNRLADSAPEALERSQALRRHEYHLFELREPGEEQAVLGELFQRYAAALQRVDQLPAEPLLASPNGLYSSCAGAGPGDFSLSTHHAGYKRMIDAGSTSQAGTRVKVAIIDSGTTVAWEPQSVVARHDFTGTGGNDVTDLRGHGSVVTAILGDIATQADYTVCRVLDRAGLASEWDVLAALFTAEDAHVVNVSLQSGLRDRTCGVCGRQTHRARSLVLERTIGAISVTDGYPVVVAAGGNDGADQLAFPARFANAVAIGSIDSAGDRSGFSNYHKLAIHPRHFVCPGGRARRKPSGRRSGSPNRPTEASSGPERHSPLPTPRRCLPAGFPTTGRSSPSPPPS